MKELNFDSGVEEYRIAGGGVLRFNPGDPNLYSRFMEATEKLADMEKSLSRQSTDGQAPEQVLELLRETDRQMKQLLDWVFGGGNDFDKALGGVNLLAVGAGGERVVTNLFAALGEILTAGAKEFADGEVARAKARRAAHE